MNCEISVVVPVYKAEGTLDECVRSLTGQSIFDKIEIILVDDGSPDKSGEICDAYAAEYANISVIHRENGGVSAARNSGIDAARGAYIGFVDSDDVVKPDMYEKLLACGGADLAMCGYLGELGTVAYDVLFPLKAHCVMGREYILNEVIELAVHCYAMFSSCNKLFRASILKENGLRFPVGIKHGEDMRFVFEFLAAAQSFFYADEILYIYKDNLQSATRKMTDYVDDYLSQYQFIDSFIKNTPVGNVNNCRVRNAARAVLSLGSQAVNISEEMSFFKAYAAVKGITSLPVLAQMFELCSGTVSLEGEMSDRVKKTVRVLLEKRAPLRIVVFMKIYSLLLNIKRICKV